MGATNATARSPRITVLAGTNGAGKSSIAGELLRQKGGAYFNPDEVTKSILDEHEGMPLKDANSLAWKQGKRLLEEAIRDGKDYTFETTLGGATITRLLLQASASGHDVRIWYAGLDSAERHVERVRRRVERGGHDIPEERIRARYDGSRENLAKLIPSLASLSVYDNSIDADPHDGDAPRPRLVLRMERGKIVEPKPEGLAATPEWAKPLAAAAMASHLAANG